MPLLKKAVDFFNGSDVDLVLHAGDYISPICARDLSKLKARMIGVFGNNDGEKVAWREKVSGWGELHDVSYEAVLEGKRILLMHDPLHIKSLAASGKYDIVIYGHTHKRHKDLIEKTLVINPGECGGWLNGHSSVALLTLPSMDVKFVELS
jgi:hypothetical protein